MKTIALFGGSFNPPHPGHFAVARYIYQALAVDEVWFVFSQNWQKATKLYASLHHRMAMGRLLAQKDSDMPFIMSDIEQRYNTYFTYDVLEKLTVETPQNRYVYIIGADNFSTFHTWANADKLIKRFPLAVVRRPSYNHKALQSPTAVSCAAIRAASPKRLLRRGYGWCLLDNPMIDMASSQFLADLAAGQTIFNGDIQIIADYILHHGLYKGVLPY